MSLDELYREKNRAGRRMLRKRRREARRWVAVFSMPGIKEAPGVAKYRHVMRFVERECERALAMKHASPGAEWVATMLTLHRLAEATDPERIES